MAATNMTSMAQTTQTKLKKEGDISDAFVSLSGTDRRPLPERFLHLKRDLIRGHEDRVVHSWKRLLGELRVENELVANQGSNVIPSLRFDTLHEDVSQLQDELRKRGVAVVRGVIPEAEARTYKDEIEEYVKKNPSTRAFPQNDPQVYELYWSAPQLKARAHSNLLKAQQLLMSLFRTPDAQSAISLSQPLSYADRLRIRQPGDASFALGPHMDGGSVERWERHGYGMGGVYDAVFRGDWETYDAWDASRRVDAVLDNYNGLGACSMLRLFQGWLSMSQTRPLEGTLMVNPLIRLSTSYLLLRPYFRPRREMGSEEGGMTKDEYLDAANWEFVGDEMTNELQGATPGFGQELNDALHPHLELDRTMVHMPEVKPGDFAIWHCDTIHAVDKVHKGQSVSSVLYIPVCPVTEINAKYMVRQRQAFIDGTPGPDFPGGKGESEHVDRRTPEWLRCHAHVDGLRAAGLERLRSGEGDGAGARKVIERANLILGF